MLMFLFLGIPVRYNYIIVNSAWALRGSTPLSYERPSVVFTCSGFASLSVLVMYKDASPLEQEEVNALDATQMNVPDHDLNKFLSVEQLEKGEYTPKAAEPKHDLHRALSARQVQMIAIGNVADLCCGKFRTQDLMGRCV